MVFKPDLKKQAVEVCISGKIVSNSPSPLSFNQSQVKIYESHKPIGLILDAKLKFNEHFVDKINKCNRIIGSIKRLSLVLSRTCLLTIYKAFVRNHLDYSDIIYEKPDYESFKDWLEKVQYNATLAIKSTIKGTSTECIYNELGLESLADRRWYRKMTLFNHIRGEELKESLTTFLQHLEFYSKFRPTKIYCIFCTIKSVFPETKIGFGETCMIFSLRIFYYIGKNCWSFIST